MTIFTCNVYIIHVLTIEIVFHLLNCEPAGAQTLKNSQCDTSSVWLFLFVWFFFLF